MRSQTIMGCERTSPTEIAEGPRPFLSLPLLACMGQIRGDDRDRGHISGWHLDVLLCRTLYVDRTHSGGLPHYRIVLFVWQLYQHHQMRLKVIYWQYNLIKIYFIKYIYLVKSLCLNMS